MEGKKIYLRHPIEEDVQGKWHEWFSDEETTKFLDARFWPNSKEMQLAFYNSLQNDKNKLVLSIVLKTNDKHTKTKCYCFVFCSANYLAWRWI